MKAMILAAGKGERMKEAFGCVHKSLLPVGGKPMIVHLIERLAKCGHSPLVINVCHQADEIMAAVKGAGDAATHVLFSREETALETAGGIANALGLLGEDIFLVMNADVHSDADLGDLGKRSLQCMEEMGTQAHLLLLDNPAHHPNGDFSLNDRLVARTEVPRPLTYSGIGLFHPEIFHPIKKGNKVPLTEILLPLVSAGKVSGEKLNSSWSDVGTPERYEELRQRLGEKG